jgi:CheY-like chemotaxis protein
VLRVEANPETRDVPARILFRGVPRKVLVVDDHRQTREAMAALLNAEGYVVCTAETGASGLAALRRDPECHLVVLDWRMPHMNGGDVLGALRATPRFADIPVIVVSGDHLTVERVHTAGGTAFLHKPADPEILLALIDRYVVPAREIGERNRSVLSRCSQPLRRTAGN